MALLLFREESAVTQEVRTTEDTKPAPPVAEPPPGGDDAGEMTLEPEERTPEEAGYGYGV
jgi:hypothetical protein